MPPPLPCRGSKGANGVLLIKTKRGTRGKTRVSYTYKLSGSTQPKGMKLLSGGDYTDDDEAGIL